MSPATILRQRVGVLNLRGKGGAETGKSLRDEVVEGLTARRTPSELHEEGEYDVRWTKSLPSILLYEGQGIDLYNEITRDERYYLFRDELNLLERHGNEIIQILSQLPQNGEADGLGHRLSRKRDLQIALVDMGAGRTEKAKCLLDSFNTLRTARAVPETTALTYCAVDIQYRELSQRLHSLVEENPSYGQEQCSVRGICASYTDLLGFLRNGPPGEESKTNGSISSPQRKCLLWLGSSFTNVRPAEAAKFLKQFAGPDVLGVDDYLLVGLDRCRDVAKVRAAYGEDLECWKTYLRNGVRSAGAVLGGDAAKELDGGDNWDYVSRWDAESSRHVRFVRSGRRRVFNVKQDRGESNVSVEIQEGEHILFSQSYKYASTDAVRCFRAAGLEVVREWANERDEGSLYLLRREKGGVRGPN